ncbi:MAG: 30S ribosomal protein S5 [Patescibacteria group bacterium]
MMPNKRGQGKRREKGFDKEKEFEQKILEIARVTRVTAGGKRMKFRACVIVGDKKGRVGMSVAKGSDVTQAVAKAGIKAEKNLVTVPLKNETIPYEIKEKFGAAVVLLKPAPKGTGVKAGGAMRNVFELAGVPNVVGKILGSKNKINNSRATINALGKLKLELRK